VGQLKGTVRRQRDDLPDNPPAFRRTELERDRLHRILATLQDDNPGDRSERDGRESEDTSVTVKQRAANNLPVVVDARRRREQPVTKIDDHRRKIAHSTPIEQERTRVTNERFGSPDDLRAVVDREGAAGVAAERSEIAHETAIVK